MFDIFSNKEFKDIVMKYAEHKATDEGEGISFLEKMEDEYDLDRQIDFSYCDEGSARAIFEETCKRGIMNMGRYWSMLLFVGLMCKRMKCTDVALYFLQWLEDNCMTPVLFVNYKLSK